MDSSRRAEPMKQAVIVILTGWAVFTAAGVHAGGLGISEADMKKVQAGWSAKKDLVGRVVYNERNERVGTIEDVRFVSDGAVPYAIVEAGGFVGTGKHDVAIPLKQFRSENGKFVLPGATKDELKALPAYAK
jgi:hypothetical protein